MNLRPADFWALSPAEWRWLAGAAGAAAPSRADVEALIRLHPDKTAPPFSAAERGEGADDQTRSKP